MNDFEILILICSSNAMTLIGTIAIGLMIRNLEKTLDKNRDENDRDA